MVKEDEREEMSEYMYTLLEPNTCNPNTCNNNGVCSLVQIATGLTAHCSCRDDWTGKYCDVQVGGE